MTPRTESNVLGGGCSSVESSGSDTGTGRIILLIDSRTPRTSKKIIAEILEKVGLEAGVAGIDCYDWRVVGHSDWKGERRLDLLDKDKGKENAGVDLGVDGEGAARMGGGGNGSRRGGRRKVDWDLFYMVSV